MTKFLEGPFFCLAVEVGGHGPPGPPIGYAPVDTVVVEI